VLLPSQRDQLVCVLEEAQRRGLVGPGAVEEHIGHSLAFGDAAGWPLRRPALDLGSGAGLPGLVLAVADPASEWVLLDGRERSTAFLGEAVRRLGVGERVEVVGERAEVAARSTLRRQMGLVVARGLGPPAVTAECAAGFLRVGGLLVVSEPPEPERGRWSDAGLGMLGMGPAEAATSAGFHFVRIGQERPAPDRFPRRTGQPAKRPLF
jgi:16S rRNA (guanine527-N7)-methyltransferase